MLNVAPAVIHISLEQKANLSLVAEIKHKSSNPNPLTYVDLKLPLLAQLVSLIVIYQMV